MAESSSQKKIQRVQRAGVTRTRGQRRPLGFALSVIAIVVVGALLVFLAREANKNSANAAPQANKDHWHMAWGIWVCDQFLPNQADAPGEAPGYDPVGIHTHVQDGLIHVHPFSKAASGNLARFGVFFDQLKIKVTDGSFTLADGTQHKDGDKCKKKDDQGNETEVEGKVKMYQWPPQANEKTEPEVITTDLRDIRFREAGQIFVLAIVPDGVTPPLPLNVKDLENPSDSGETPTQNQAPGSSVPDTALPGGTVPEVTVPDASAPNNTAPAGSNAPPTTGG